MEIKKQLSIQKMYNTYANTEKHCTQSEYLKFCTTKSVNSTTFDTSYFIYIPTSNQSRSNSVDCCWNLVYKGRSFSRKIITHIHKNHHYRILDYMQQGLLRKT
jgi:oligoribonuclease (3'-5' exoribonuclease)